MAFRRLVCRLEFQYRRAMSQIFRCRWRHCCSFKTTQLMISVIQHRNSPAVRSPTFSIPWCVPNPVGVAITPRGLREYSARYGYRAIPSCGVGRACRFRLGRYDGRSWTCLMRGKLPQTPHLESSKTHQSEPLAKLRSIFSPALAKLPYMSLLQNSSQSLFGYSLLT